MPLAPLPAGLYGYREATIKRVFSADPAANAEWTITVPAATAYVVRAVTAVLVQDITATPQPLLRITDGTDIVFSCFGSIDAQDASTTCRYSWFPGSAFPLQIGATTDVHSIAPIPDNLLLLPGWTIGSYTIGLAATSNWGAASAYVIEYT